MSMINSVFQTMLVNLATILKSDAVLVDDASLNGHVSANNIRPYYDAAPNEPGGLLTYAFSGTDWDRRYRRGKAELNVMAESGVSAAEADGILERFREIVLPATLTGTGCRVALFLEQPQGSSDLAPKLGGYAAKAVFSVRLGAE